MKAGVIYPQTELGGDVTAVKKFAQAAEEMGYDHIVIYDHVLGADHEGREPPLRGPYKNTDPFHEPLITYAYLAGVTSTIELVTGVLILPQRQTALVAKQAADVDLFSGGRLRLGVGVGWNWVEFDGLEMPGTFKKRGRRQESQIALMRKLWGDELIDHTDDFHRIDRAGRIADGFLFSGRTQADAVEIKGRIEGMLAENGRADHAFGFESIQPYSNGANRWPGDIAAWREAGSSHISVVTMGSGFDSVDAHIDAIGNWRKTYDAG